MIISWNEIKDHALHFSREWAEEKKEMAEYQTFWDDFFAIFGVRRRAVAIYQKKVEMLGNKRGFIDLFWPGELLVEHKSSGQSLDAAFTQATDYFSGLEQDQYPRYVIVSDYKTIRLYDLEAEGGVQQHDFPLKELHKHVRLFGFIAGYQSVKTERKEDPINVKAAAAVGKLHDALKESGYTGHALEVLLTRLVFCFFADDAGIFDRDQFINYVELKTKADGSDLGLHLGAVFQALDTSIDKRQKALDEDLAAFPYVDGGLFSEQIAAPSFDSSMRKILIACMVFNWQDVSPAIFGSMFQSVMDEQQRHDLGAHYTSETNILKVINGLFLDELRQEFELAKSSKPKLTALWEKISKMKLLDPACGCGNFLVVAYRELRLLEMDIVARLYEKNIGTGQNSLLTTQEWSKLDVDMMYGIEIEEFPRLVAQLALWLTDHQMNVKFSELVGQARLRLPLTHTPTIVHGNALQLDWKDIISPKELTHILGNPPFVGSKVMSDEQRAELSVLFKGVHGAGVLDYVTGWYVKTADYTQGTNIRVAFVSTNSITQGEQVSILWKWLFSKGVKINFAHRTFKWTNEAKGKAAVYCVIIGWALLETPNKYIFEYEDVRSEPHKLKAKHINPYLVDAVDVFIMSRNFPLSKVPKIGIGNKPIDDGNYLFTTDEKIDFVDREPSAERYFRRWLGADEFLNGYERWCLWLGEAQPEELRSMPEVLKRIEAVKQFRLASKSAPTRKLADKPTRFHVENIPTTEYLVIPEVSSERRYYIPIGYLQPETLASNLLKVITEATVFHFGILQSLMHMAWTRTVCGRLELRYRYSADLVYNNFPWPEKVTEEHKKEVETAAKGVLDARAQHKKATLADLYDPLTMPKDLLDAHHTLDGAVDRAYGRTKFENELERVEFLFELYQLAVAKEKK